MSEKFPSQVQDKFTVRFPDGLRDAIAERAKKNGRSMNSEIIWILEDVLSVSGEYVPTLGEDPNEKFVMDSQIGGKIERLEGTIKELFDYVKNNTKKPT